MKMPKTIGLVHFIGIGGIGMSGIAEVLHNLGHRVQGSDQAESANVQRLRAKGIEVFVGHKAENLGEAEVVRPDLQLVERGSDLRRRRGHARGGKARCRAVGRIDHVAAEQDDPARAGRARSRPAQAGSRLADRHARAAGAANRP